MEDNVLYINGIRFEALVVPYTEQIAADFVEFVKENPKFPVIFTDKLPERTVNGDNLSVLSVCEVIALADISTALKNKGMFDIIVDTEFKDLSFYHYIKDGKNLFVFLNESAEDKFSGNVMLPATKDVIYYDVWNQECQKIENVPAILKNENAVQISLELEPGEIAVFIENTDKEAGTEHKSFAKQRNICEKQIGLTSWKVSKVRAIDYPGFGETIQMETLEPISFTEPTFSGIIRYESEAELEEMPTEAYLYAEHVYEVMKVIVNENEVGKCIRPPYQMNITNYLKTGKNKIVIEVATTPAREQLNGMRPPFDFCHETLEPTGMYGDVKIFLSEK